MSDRRRLHILLPERAGQCLEALTAHSGYTATATIINLLVEAAEAKKLGPFAVQAATAKTAWERNREAKAADAFKFYYNEERTIEMNGVLYVYHSTRDGQIEWGYKPDESPPDRTRTITKEQFDAWWKEWWYTYGEHDKYVEVQQVQLTPDLDPSGEWFFIPADPRLVETYERLRMKRDGDEYEAKAQKRRLRYIEEGLPERMYLPAKMWGVGE